MRRWSKTLGLLAAGLLSLGEFHSVARAQFPPPGGNYGPPPEMPAQPPDAAHAAKEPTSPYSIKDDGLPNAFNLGRPAWEPLNFQLSLGYTLLWFKPGNLPALATTGSASDANPGALGQPNTSIISGGSRDPGASNAFRGTFTYWLKDPEVFGLDVNFFIMEQRSKIQDFHSDANGNPVLARPYINANTGQEASDLRSLPGVLQGSLSDAMRTRLMGSEVNLRWCDGNNYDGSSISLLCGARWLRLDETYSNFDTSGDVGGGNSFTFADNFATFNQFFAGQVGGEWMYRFGSCKFSVLTKLAVGANFQTIKVNGQTVAIDPSGNVTTAAQGLFAQPTNIGVFNSVRLAVLPETAVNFSVDLTDRIRFNIGYTFIVLFNTVRPGDQIDRHVNIQALGAPVAPPFLPPPPSFHESNFNAQMLNLAVEFLF